MTIVVASASVGRVKPCRASVSMIVDAGVTLPDNAIAHRAFAGRAQALPQSGFSSDKYRAGAQVSRTASDQHQPASSRTIAVVLTTGQFLRASNASINNLRASPLPF
ncbi:hypothetical protein [Mycobacterium camsae]|uniref:hypothetical protein n=1 Tax=Mycobacterium gordonae TaxID=1778 RepID=UPI00197F9E93|nr:hypothetical protein [Mycobacterium gordonae]